MTAGQLYHFLRRQASCFLRRIFRKLQSNKSISNKMKFKDIKQGYVLHIFDKKEIRVSHVKVTDVSPAHVDMTGGVSNLVVDVKTDDGKTYVVQADSECAYPDGRVLSTSEPIVLVEVKAMKSAADQTLSQIDHHRMVSDKCAALMEELDPTEREKKETEARFAKIEDKMDSIMEMLKKITE